MLIYTDTSFAHPVMTYHWSRSLLAHSSSTDAIFNGRGIYNICGRLARYFERIQSARRQNLLVTATNNRGSLESRLLVRIWRFLICNVEVPQPLVALNNPALPLYVSLEQEWLRIDFTIFLCILLIESI